MYRRLRAAELEVIGKTENGEKIYKCPLTEEQSLGKTLGMTKSGHLYCLDGKKPREIKPYKQWKEKGRKRNEYKVRIQRTVDGVCKRKRYNIARLMCICFWCVNDEEGTRLDIRGDWTVDHKHLINGGSGYVASDTTRWTYQDISVCTLKENKRRWKEAQKKAVDKGMI